MKSQRALVIALLLGGSLCLANFSLVHGQSVTLNKSVEFKRVQSSFFWMDPDPIVAHTTGHDRAPSIIGMKPMSPTPFYVAYEEWSGTSTPDFISVVQSTDYGQSWLTSSVFKLNSDYALKLPSLAVENQWMYVAFNLEYDPSDNDIFVVKLSTADLTTYSVHEVDASGIDHTRPSLVSDYAFYSPAWLHIAYVEKGSTNSKLLYRRSTDGGANWLSAQTLANNYFNGASNACEIAIYGSTIIVVFDEWNGASSDIYYVRSTDRGVSWSAAAPLIDTDYSVQYASIGIHDQSVIVVAEEEFTSDWDIQYRRSVNGGSTWVGGLLEASTNDERYPRCKGDLTNVSAELSISYADITANEIRVSSGTGGPTGWSSHVANSSGRQISADDLTSVVSLNYPGNGPGAVWAELRQSASDFDVLFDGEHLPMDVTNDERQLSFSLSPNHPNPFNPTTNIRFSLPETGEVVLSVHNSLGQSVETLISGRLSGGEHMVVWNATNHASGIYFCRLDFEGQQRMIKMALVK